MEHLIDEKLLTEDKILHFGKYKGTKIKDIASENPNYIVWLHEETEWSVEEDLYEDCLERKEEEGFFGSF